MSLTDKEKKNIYKGIKKKHLIEMLIEAQSQLNFFTSQRSEPTIDDKKVPYNTLCSCNPANGGDGICGCTMGNKMVDVSHDGTLKWTTDTTATYVNDLMGDNVHMTSIT